MVVFKGSGRSEWNLNPKILNCRLHDFTLRSDWLICLVPFGVIGRMLSVFSRHCFFYSVMKPTLIVELCKSRNVYFFLWRVLN